MPDTTYSIKIVRNMEHHMNTSITADRKSDGFWRGFTSGLTAPFSAFGHHRVSVDVDSELLTNSYRPPSEDCENIRKYFNKALDYAFTEAEAKANEHK